MSDIKEYDVVQHPTRPNVRLHVQSILDGKAACKVPGEIICKEYPVSELTLIQGRLRGPLRPVFG